MINQTPANDNKQVSVLETKLSIGLKEFIEKINIEKDNGNIYPLLTIVKWKEIKWIIITKIMDLLLQ